MFYERFSTIQPMATSATVLVIFGVTGDLANKKLLPALYSLEDRGALDNVVSIVGFARRPWNTNDFVDQAHSSVLEASKTIDDTSWKRFSTKLTYIKSDFAEAHGFTILNSHFDTIEKKLGGCTNRIFYFATPPSIYPILVEQLKKADLAHGCPVHGSGVARVVIEKPFGHDLQSAKELHKLFLQVFAEDQIFRMDHYLGKETVQNILAFRFANAIFEPLWNANYIDHVQITAAEDIGIEDRGAYYEEAGALRDFVQNHLLQLLAAIALERPQSLAAASIRAQRTAILRSLKSVEGIASQTIRGQYTDYRQEPKVSPDSQVETFVALKLFLNDHRFKNVPFYLRTGKRLKEKVTDITVQFKPVKDSLFRTDQPTPFPNTITLRLQPNEGISVRLFTKKPGLGNVVVPSQMDFCYRDAFGGAGQDAYSRLILDVIAGDQTLFTSSEEVEAAWSFVTPILKAWQKSGQETLQYEPGSWGPKEADELIGKDNRQWLAQHLIVCPIHEQHTY